MEEVATFKKVAKKKRKLRKRVVVKADDLLGLEDDTGGGDLGSRWAQFHADQIHWIRCVTHKHLDLVLVYDMCIKSSR